jgi:hypothetical protein
MPIRQLRRHQALSVSSNSKLNKPKVKACWIAILFFSLVSCGEKFEEEQLYGEYELNHWSKDTLELKKGGTYFYRTYLNNRKLENSGKWELNANGNEIRFENFSFPGEAFSKGNWFSKLKTDGNEIHLMYASEENIYFKKLPSK